MATKTLKQFDKFYSKLKWKNWEYFSIQRHNSLGYNVTFDSNVKTSFTFMKELHELYNDIDNKGWEIISQDREMILKKDLKTSKELYAEVYTILVRKPANAK